jgi:hypothetical protein
VTQDRSQTGGEGQPYLGMDLDLVDPVELILDRVFRGDDLGLFVLDFVQAL